MLIGPAWTVLVGFLLLRAVRHGRAFQRQTLLPQPAADAMPTVAVIVPTRDEAANIGLCLEALERQRYPAARMSVTVVDDSSADDTPRIVRRRAPRVELLDAGPLPPGWLGKPHACWVGALNTQAEWLCFIDADVRAEPALLASAVRSAQTGGVDLLSVHPLQELGSFWERLIMPAGMLVIACGKPAPPHCPQGAADISVNGQIMLVRAAAYHAVGGHGAVRAEVAEDHALARRLHAAGYRVRVVAGERLARARMYRTLPALWEGFAKNAGDIFGSDRVTLSTAAAALLASWAVFAVPLWTLAAEPAGPALGVAICRVTACGASLAALGLHAAALRHFRAPALLAALLPVGVTMAAAIAVESVWRRRTGHVSWKGRTYDLPNTRLQR
ncbi:MAG: glycosyltransferase family 2 protein [Acetobacteraceae bacterium]|nr:glycosyltransferase family 2 protein [Acetobacteraceae bacterium]